MPMSGSEYWTVLGAVGLTGLLGRYFFGPKKAGRTELGDGGSARCHQGFLNDPPHYEHATR